MLPNLPSMFVLLLYVGTDNSLSVYRIVLQLTLYRVVLYTGVTTVGPEMLG